jgi:hypothetical protein
MKMEYCPRDVEELDRKGGHYARHLSAIVDEQLYSRADIAAELAWRDVAVDEASAAGAAEATARIVRLMRKKARAHKRLARMRCNPHLMRWSDSELGHAHHAMASALRTVADLIERGEA